MKLSITFVALLIATGAVSLPNFDSADSMVPETAQQTVDREFTEFELLDAHKEAKATVDNLVQTGKSQDECAKLADATLKEISSGVGANQKMLNALPSGASCASEGQQAVTAATKALSNAKSASASAQTAKQKADTAPVKFGTKGFAELKEGDCSAFMQHPAYTKARAAKKAADTTAAQRQGVHKGAVTNLSAAKKAQQLAIGACNCKTHKAHEKALKAANANNAANKKAWRKAHLMKCVLVGTAMSNCNIPSAPKVTTPPKSASANCNNANRL